MAPGSKKRGATRHSATVAKRAAAATGSGKAPQRRPAKALPTNDNDDDAFFLDDGTEDAALQGKSGASKGASAVVADAEELERDLEARETVEEKRHRLAKQYLSQLRATVDEEDFGRARGVTGDSDGEEGDEEEDEADPDRSRRARSAQQDATTSGRDRLTQLLQVDAAQAAGRVQRTLAQHVVIPDLSAAGGAARRGHRLPATALALAPDDSQCWTVSKDGSIVCWDLERGTKTHLHRGPTQGAAQDEGSSGPEWVNKGPRAAGRGALSAVAVSSDGALLAVGGGDRKVHVFDLRAGGGYVQAFPGHRDAVTSLAFREGTHTLFSASCDRTVKLWSLDDRAYMDTLFGHQQEVLCLDVGRAERAVSCGADRTCRVWKIPEESQLILKHSSAGAAQTLDCCKLVTSGEWVSGASDGSLQLWTQLKRKPIFLARNAHGPRAPPVPHAAGCLPSGCPLDVDPALLVGGPPDVTGWVQSVAVAKGSDLVASGAGDGAIRLWQVTHSKAGGVSGLALLGGLPARGWVNGLAVARSGRFVVAAVGQEPRLGRWARDAKAHNGLLMHRLDVAGTQ